MKGNRIVLIGGGTHSGKTAFATELALRLGETRAFVATTSGIDEQTKGRISQCRRDRGDRFTTFEEPVALVERLEMLGDQDVVVVDCVANWLSNLQLRKYSVQNILGQVERLTTVLAARRFHAVLVSHELGLSAPPTAEGRALAEIAGSAHQRLARVSDELYLAVMGVLTPIRAAELLEPTPHP
jgi:adenosylcobinamide kinase / adenosylcobinamide-phosphate guanylyltransferase